MSGNEYGIPQELKEVQQEWIKERKRKKDFLLTYILNAYKIDRFLNRKLE